MKMAKFCSTFVAILAIVMGILLSPIPKHLGVYRWIAENVEPALIGMTPAFLHGVEWGYTFDDLARDCDSIRGQSALVTGANSGTGFWIATNLAKCGAKVTLACRNAQRCDMAAEKIKRVAHPDAVISTSIVDTSSLSSVRSFCKDYLERHGDEALDMLYLNAGRTVDMNDGKSKSLVLSVDGIEAIFATNYLGHHLMWKYLSPLVHKSKMGRVVQTSSAASFDTFRHKVATSLDTLQNDSSLPKSVDMKWYGQSKLAQIIWSKKVTRDLGPNSTIYVNAAHPGAVHTAIWDKASLPEFLTPILNIFKGLMWTVEEGVLTLLFLGVALNRLKEDNVRGKYFHPQSLEVVNPLALDEELQDDLWIFSDELVSNFYEG